MGVDHRMEYCVAWVGERGVASVWVNGMNMSIYLYHTSKFLST
jgi:hypothetical protein